MRTKRFTIIAFVAGFVIASAGTATAAKLITGRQIKDGSIGTRDLSKKVRAEIENRFPSGDVPSGKTVRGNYAVATYSSSGSEEHYGMDSISFGFSFASAPQTHMILKGGTPPTGCPGTAENPQADPGHLCVYEGNNNRGSATIGVFSPADGLSPSNRWGAGVILDSFGTNAANSYGTWAATAP